MNKDNLRALQPSNNSKDRLTNLLDKALTDALKMTEKEEDYLTCHAIKTFQDNKRAEQILKDL